MMRSVAFCMPACVPAFLASAALAGPPMPIACSVPEYLTHVDGRLVHVTKQVQKDKRLELVVVGTGSSTLGGQNGASAAYPARLEAALAERLPGVAVTVKVDVKPRRTTADMASAFPQMLAGAKPTAIIWQTGTFDAIRGVDPDEFRTILDKGVVDLQAAGTDVVLVNMQYSPRTESMIVASPYLDSMRWVAQQHDVPLFDRLAVMKHWNETGAFDLSAPDRNHVAERVHDCLGQLLAELIIDNAHLGQAAKEHR